MSKVEGGGVRLIPPLPRLRVTIFSRRLLGLILSCLLKTSVVVTLSAFYFLKFIFVLFFRSFKALPVARRSGFAKPRANCRLCLGKN